MSDGGGAGFILFHISQCNFRVITMRGRGISFHGPVNSGEAGGHRSKPEVVLTLSLSTNHKLISGNRLAKWLLSLFRRCTSVVCCKSSKNNVFPLLVYLNMNGGKKVNGRLSWP